MIYYFDETSTYSIVVYTNTKSALTLRKKNRLCINQLIDHLDLTICCFFLHLLMTFSVLNIITHYWNINLILVI